MACSRSSELACCSGVMTTPEWYTSARLYAVPFDDLADQDSFQLRGIRALCAAAADHVWREQFGVGNPALVVLRYLVAEDDQLIDSVVQSHVIAQRQRQRRAGGLLNVTGQMRTGGARVAEREQ